MCKKFLQLETPEPPVAVNGLKQKVAKLFVKQTRKLQRVKTQIMRCERGAVTAEYAIVIMAAVAFAGLLVVILRSPEVQDMLKQLVQNALESAG